MPEGNAPHSAIRVIGRSAMAQPRWVAATSSHYEAVSAAVSGREHSIAGSACRLTVVRAAEIAFVRFFCSRVRWAPTARPCSR
ncbi:hypothetical protein SPRG_07693 [Saprolegnia parasitica CBS 223.65]|uniref:Uncharacterized protein n=1 Tax=Saprolegnia parasitica (strain CBS 223.65) TaxID=695850 RepID=A0A067CCR5_SAPPC|nr:hypothetical protein SPRG_07693 [Saprolegnia parasitica CBS 223.65]KDO26980.1 hypothetical protein SPRG_07693 [Saprolegnia parasitica CBS 223.65]|eukprot:XP_012202361.1 hypothetical protein SPRG_07693 [Saprolegnia parasitica CBS 223.65]